MRNIITYISAIVLMAFGLITLFMSSSVIFDLFGIRAREGNYVLFVVWSNFVSSILYLLSAYGFMKSKKWTAIPLVISTIILAAAFIGLKLHINAGGAYEMKTVWAMAFRTGLTLIFMFIAYFVILKKQNR
ncbi:MAG TPA: hypothetical protein VI583_01155 [Cyclobacteriaceae bacterium]|nr:hypothetical protein [Cyclobacteriaceae bacterium]